MQLLNRSGRQSFTAAAAAAAAVRAAFQLSDMSSKEYLHACVLMLARVQQMKHRRQLVGIQMVVTAGKATASKRQQPDHDGAADPETNGELICVSKAHC